VPPEADAELRLRLASAFRYVHEPLSSGRTEIPLLGHAELVASIVQRIRYSSGGAFLVGGFRGTGKTTLLRQVSSALRQDGGARTYAFVSLNVARPVSSGELLFRVMRRIFEELDDSDLLDLLPPHVRNAIVLAYTRTSMAVATKNSATREGTTTIGLSAKSPGADSGAATPTVTATLQRVLKTTHSLATEASFLTYSDMDVEHDFLRIIELLRSSSLRSPSLWARLFGQGRRPPIHVVLVLDELDKLTSEESGVESLNAMLMTLKNVLTTPGIHTLFVGGTELIDAAIGDTHEGIGIFESIFSWSTYVPCLWASPERLLSAIVTEGSIADLELFTDYLRYRSRGVPRRLLQELNSFVRWIDGVPCVVVPAHERSRVDLYAELATVVESYVGRHLGETHSSLDDDRFRLGTYYVLDWILRSEGGVFDARGITQRRRGIGSIWPGSETLVAEFLEHLAQYSVIDKVSQEGAYLTQIPSSHGARTSEAYRLSVDLRERLLHVARTNKRERALLLGTTSPPGGPAAQGPAGVGAPAWGAPPPSPPAAPPYGQPAPYGQAPWYGPPPYGQPAAPAPRTPTPPSAPGDRAPQPLAPAQPRWTSPPSTSSGRAPTTDFFPSAPPAPMSTGGVLGSSTPDSDQSANWAVPRHEQLLGGGRYRLDDVIGTGGMSVVYRATLLATEQTVAIKVLRESMSWDEQIRQRFRQEASTVGSLEHPSVIKVHEFVTEPDGRLALVMDYIEGRTLADRLHDEPPLSGHQIVEITRKLLEAVHYLHERGLRRLDIKPSNIVLKDDESPVIIDLGIAKPPVSTVQTDAGGMIGTPAYMSPEQIRSEPVDQTSDLFSLGIVLFEQLTRAPLYADMGPFEVIKKRISEDLPVEVLACSEQLRQVVGKLTARDKTLRYHDAAEATAALCATPEAMQGTVAPVSA
jgi:tRNA A-37 threonylcarbamoyl transferase component Bud32